MIDTDGRGAGQHLGSLRCGSLNMRSGCAQFPLAERSGLDLALAVRFPSSGFTPALEEGQRIERRRVSPDLEIELGRTDASGLAGRTNDVAALKLIASLNLKLFRVRVGGCVAVSVAYEDEIAELLKAVTGVNHDAIVGRGDWGALRYRDRNAVVCLVVRLGAKARN